ncbi:MAG: cryptochrome/photolyase family protein [Rhodospirillaceae bacterium]
METEFPSILIGHYEGRSLGVLRLILGDQLSARISALHGASPNDDTVVMFEVMEECSYVPHHKQKIILFLSAMRHFALELQNKGFTVDYVKLDDKENTGSLTGEIKRALERHRVTRIAVTEPGEWRIQEMFESWRAHFGTPVQILPDTRFFASKDRFKRWADRRKVWRMEHFYREMRKEHKVLMNGDKPLGGTWNFDTENRKKLPRDIKIPNRLRHKPDKITKDVTRLVSQKFPNNFGSLEGFGWPVTRNQALQSLEHFFEIAFTKFGDYQDSMKEGEIFLFHSLISPSLNIGLLSPREVCEAAELALSEGEVPINAVEGFIRQILGWREYIRGVYWELMPQYASCNSLSGKRSLPEFYWTGVTDLACLREAIGSTQKTAYSHHIQRLMITGNFAALIGVEPRQLERWYLAVYADAIEWVEMPNTLGMALFADGGKMASKPYISSGSYINRMSDFCAGCKYSVQKKNGAEACPFNYLYWGYLIRHESQLAQNPRMAMPYRTLRSWDDETKNTYLHDTEEFLKTL